MSGQDWTLANQPINRVLKILSVFLYRVKTFGWYEFKNIKLV